MFTPSSGQRLAKTPKATPEPYLNNLFQPSTQYQPYHLHCSHPLPDLQQLTCSKFTPSSGQSTAYLFNTTPTVPPTVLTPSSGSSTAHLFNVHTLRLAGHQQLTFC
mmetsp:Transcript_14948/g.26127  ORF Transcript_14948/g.26127 Transcript_14948/m.26127 type:complete len:106 (+) Transcript_14948:2124-2441(+)